MSRTSRSPRKVARWALKIGQWSLPEYAHRCSPKTYTQPQLLAILVLQSFLGTGFRGVEAILDDFSELRDDPGLARVPHASTLCKARRRLLRRDPARNLLSQSAHAALGRRRRIAKAAIDSTGLCLGRVSEYFVKRRYRAPNHWQTTRYRRWGKLTLIVGCQAHTVLAAHACRGPGPDVNRLVQTLGELAPQLCIDTLYADAGYDSEPNHEHLRDTHGIRSIIPPKHGRPSKKPAKGKHRRNMQRLFRNPQKIGYGQRWQVETVNSMIKRNLARELTSQSYPAQNREMWLLAITHNVMIALYLARGYQRGIPDTSYEAGSVKRFFVCLYDDGSSLLSELSRGDAGPFNWLRSAIPILFSELQALGVRRVLATIGIRHVVVIRQVIRQ